MKKILITGATGFIGGKLLKQLMMSGYDDINILTRNAENTEKKLDFPAKCFEWDIKNQKVDAGAFKGVDTIFHLAGENIADGRWSEEKKKRIIESRTKSSELIKREVQKIGPDRKIKIISASAVGYYGDRGDEVLTEASSKGSGFLSDVCEQWEKSLKDIQGNINLHFIRIGLVLSKDGGALPKMELPFKFGVAGKIGDGTQYMSWIHIKDLIDLFIFVGSNNVEGLVFNGVSPNPVTNEEFTKTMGKVLSRPTFLKAPKFLVETALGEMSAVLLNGQRVKPENALKNGFNFQFTSLETALKDLFFYDLKGERRVFKCQFVEKPRPEVFEFFSDEYNLEKITPPLLNFKVLSKSTPEIQEGTIIDYKLKLRGLPMKWKSLIKDFVKNEKFIDTQLKGPYKKWVHLHGFHDLKDGTLMTDDIVYKVPFGFIGRLFTGALVKRDVDEIFNYRQKVIGEIFNGK